MCILANSRRKEARGPSPKSQVQRGGYVKAEITFWFSTGMQYVGRTLNSYLWILMKA